MRKFQYYPTTTNKNNDNNNNNNNNKYIYMIRYYLPKIEIKECNFMIDRKTFLISQLIVL